MEPQWQKHRDQSIWPYWHSVRFELIYSYRYYYLGHIDKAKYYHSKATKGEVEPTDSKIRKIYAGLEKRRHNEYSTQSTRIDKGNFSSFGKQIV